jgi:hypothetical protein
MCYPGISSLAPAYLPPEPFPAAPESPFVPSWGPPDSARPHWQPVSRTLFPPPALVAPLAATKALLSRRHRQRRKPPHDRSEQPPRQVPFGQKSRVVPGVFDQTTTRLHRALLQARQRLRVDPLRQREPPPQIPQVVGDDAQPRHLNSLLAFPNPLLGRPALVVEPHHRRPSTSRVVRMKPTRGDSSP